MGDSIVYCYGIYYLSPTFFIDRLMKHMICGFLNNPRQKVFERNLTINLNSTSNRWYIHENIIQIVNI